MLRIGSQFPPVPTRSTSGRRELQASDIESTEFQRILKLAIRHLIFDPPGAVPTKLDQIILTYTNTPGEIKVTVTGLDTLHDAGIANSDLLATVESADFASSLGTQLDVNVIVTEVAVINRVVPQPSPPPSMPPSPPSPPPPLPVGLVAALSVGDDGEVTWVVIIAVVVVLLLIGCAAVYYCGRRDGKNLITSRLPRGLKLPPSAYPSVRHDDTDSIPPGNPPPPMTSLLFPSMSNVPQTLPTSPGVLSPQQVVGMAVELGMAVERQQSFMREGATSPRSPSSPRAMQRVNSLSLSRQASYDAAHKGGSSSAEDLTNRLDDVRAALDDVRALAESLSHESSPRHGERPVSFSAGARTNPRSPASLPADGDEPKYDADGTYEAHI